MRRTGNRLIPPALWPPTQLSFSTAMVRCNPRLDTTACKKNRQPDAWTRCTWHGIQSGQHRTGCGPSSPDFSKPFTPPTRNVPGSQEIRCPISRFSNANSSRDKCRQATAYSSDVTMSSPTPALPTAFDKTSVTGGEDSDSFAPRLA
ncbi:hypothetical protein GGI43DRAFT_49350 [Trichoderma evansii]